MPDRPAGKLRRGPWLLSPRRQRVIRLGPWPRRVLALALLGLAIVLALRPEHPGRAGADPVTTVVVAARTLPAGRRLVSADLRTVRWPTRLVPTGALRDPSRCTGRTLAASLPAGGVVTDLSTVGPALARSLGGPDATAVPVHLSDPGFSGLLRPGDAVDILAGKPGAAPNVVAAKARVLIVLPGGKDPLGDDGTTVVVSAATVTARRLALIASDEHVALVLRSQ